MKANPYLDLLNGGGSQPPAQAAQIKEGISKSGNAYLDLLQPEIEKQTRTSGSPFNPNTPAHDEFVSQLDQRTPSSSLFKNFFSSLVDLNTYKTPNIKQTFFTRLQIWRIYIKPFPVHSQNQNGLILLQE